MKNLFIASLFLAAGIVSAQVGINTTGASPDPSAGLDINFTDKGLLPLRVALTSITSAGPVTAPANGLLVYNTATSGASPTMFRRATTTGMEPSGFRLQILPERI